MFDRDNRWVQTVAVIVALGAATFLVAAGLGYFVNELHDIDTRKLVVTCAVVAWMIESVIVIGVRHAS